MGPNYYPPGGHDWVATDELRKEAAHNDALLAEMYNHEVVNLRADIWRNLAGKHVLDEKSEGWAIYHITDSDGSVATADFKEILLLHLFPKAEHPLSGHAPCIRIVTNEMFLGEEGQVQYMTEDICIDLNNYALYSIDSVMVKEHEDGPLTDLRELPIPMFQCAQDGAFGVTRAFPVSPVRHRVGELAISKQLVEPFGAWQHVADMYYALDKAKALFEEVRDLEPTFQSARRSE